ncbi:MAG: biotin--[acetyl-CoA-carboxylase] ligase [Gemmatimonadetes bacterium]|nr:biotin--[acetyl-CoA-carboxylase] ligase [Gemmatimonadota bacterium]
MSAPLDVWEDRPVEKWRDDWGIPALEIHPSLGSTNDRALALAAAGAAGLTTVIADEQTAGRGRGGRLWASPAGLGLWLSVILRLDQGAASPLLSVALGAVVARMLESVAAPAAPGLKWPNDVLLGGKKVCGILCEIGDGAQVVIAGIGLNILQRQEHFAPEIRETATSILLATGKPVPRSALAGELLRGIQRWLVPLPRRLERQLAREVARFDVLRGRKVRTSTGVSGWAVGIAADGALVVLDQEGLRRRVLGGSVELASAPLGREEIA